MGSVVGGLVGQKKAKGAYAQSEAQINAAVEALESVGVPTVEAQKIALEAPELVYQYVPELETAEALGPSRMEELPEDPRLRAAQIGVLERLGELGEAGLTGAEKAEQRKLQREAAGAFEARRKSIMQDMAQRGALDSGMMLAQQLAAAQQSAQGESEAMDRLAQQAQARALQSMGQEADVARGLRSEDFRIGGEKAKAADEIARFNQQQRAAVQQRNIAARNLAQQQMAQAKQRQEEMRADVRNRQEQYNKALQQQRFSNLMQQAGAVASARTGAAQQQAQKAQATAQGYSQMGSGVDTMLLGGAKALGMSDINAKTNIEPAGDKLKDMLNQLEAYKYKYKDPERFGEGNQVGIMAQDLEKSEVGQEFVEDTKDGKMVDYGKMAPTLLAAQSELNDESEDLKARIKALESMLGVRGE